MGKSVLIEGFLTPIFKIIFKDKVNAIEKALKDSRQNKTNKPIMIIANTIKGKGVSFMESELLWHYKYPNDKELKLALQELEKNGN